MSMIVAVRKHGGGFLAGVATARVIKGRPYVVINHGAWSQDLDHALAHLEKIMNEQLGMFEERAHARRTDPETSHEAAASVVKLTLRQAAVLRCFQDTAPLSDTELAEEYHYRPEEEPPWYPLQSESGLRTRRRELVDKGRLRFSGEYGLTASGRRTRIWEVVR